MILLIIYVPVRPLARTLNKAVTHFTLKVKGTQILAFLETGPKKRTIKSHTSRYSKIENAPTEIPRGLKKGHKNRRKKLTCTAFCADTKKRVRAE
jgi:hypothetical protein